MISIAQRMARLADFFSGNQNGAGLPLSNRNYFVDGNFESWSVTSVTMSVGSADYSPATMYYAYTGDSPGQATLSQTDLTTVAGLGGLTTPYRYGHRWLQTAASTNANPYLNQRVEGARTLSGRSATFSCWLWSNTGSNISISTIMAQQSFGTGGSPSASVLSDKAVNWIVTPTPQRFSVRIDLPSVAGKTFGSGGNDYLQIGLYLPKGATFDLITTQWQLEQCSPQSSSDLSGAGGLPTTFEYRGSGPELARVQRFYETGQEPFLYIGGLTGVSTAYGDFQFRTTKIKVPIITFNGGWQYYSSGSNTVFTPVGVGATIDRGYFEGTGLSVWQGWNAAGIWTADARY